MSTTQVFVANVNARIKCGEVTVNGISDDTGIHRTDLSRLLNGRRNSCTLDRAEAIAQALNVTLDELVKRKAERIAELA